MMNTLRILLIGSLLAVGCEEENTTPPAPPDFACSSSNPTMCFGVCTNLATDAQNCGKCDNRCDPGAACVNGACTPLCPKGQVACGNACADLQSDPGNCGKCGSACGPGEVCSGGDCTVSCQPGLTNCSGACVNVKTDTAHCGDCKTVCAKGQYCTNGACAANCGPGFTDCNGICVDLTNDSRNCGKCGGVCEPGKTCSASVCTANCAPGWTDCKGTCQNLANDPQNCGQCGTVCPPGQLCANGSCAANCANGWTDCKGLCQNLQNDAQNCGACGTICPPGQFCSAGKCAANCANGWTDCGGLCQNLQDDALNCGACAKVCAPGQACVKGVCSPNCGGNQKVCGNTCVDLTSDPANCGACGTVCAKDLACVNNTCQLLCILPTIVCGKSCVDPRYDPANCGGCGKACAVVANGAPGCANGACTVGSCNAGYKDCDGRVDNGCEIDLIHDAKNCGACGRSCGLGKMCCNGFCLADLTGVNCGNQFGVSNVVGNGFSMGGNIDQLVVDNTGISTQPAQMNPPPALSPHVWVAMHGTNQVNKVDAKTGAVLGTYPTRGVHPSRVAVALDLSVWIGNRGDDSPDDPTHSNVAQILPDGTPGCTITKAADGKTIPFIRGVAIDGNGFVWFGSWNDQRLHKVDPAACKVIADFSMANQTINGQVHSSYVYGLVADRNGLLWNSALDAGTAWFAMDTKAIDPALNKWKYAVPKNGACSYGIVIDKNNNVFMSLCTGGAGLHRIDGKTQAYSRINPNNQPGIISGSGCGITIDLAGDIYQAGCSYYAAGNYVYKYAGGTGNYIGAYTFPTFTNQSGTGTFLSMFGIAGDTYGKIWVTDRNTASLCRFDATGKVEVQTKLPGSDCYNYSDWNAIVLKTVTSNNAQAGTWVRDFDSGSATALWLAANWDSVTPVGTSVATYFKAATTQAGLATAPSCGPFYAAPVDLTACSFGKKQWLNVTVNLNTNDVNVRPTFDNLKVYFQQ